MDGELSFDNILGAEDVKDLFASNEVQESTTVEVDDDNPDDTQENNNENETQTTEVNTDNLFTDSSESVGSEGGKDITEEDTTSSTKTAGNSPKSNNFYSSMTGALVEDGVFQLSEEEISNVKSAEDFLNMIKALNQAMLDDTQKRVNDALNYGVEESEVAKYERGIAQLEGVTDELLTAENEQGEQLRKWLIFQDYINSGKSKEYAQRMVDRAISAGTDVDDAREALQSNIQHFKDLYLNIIDDARAQQEEFLKERAKRAEELKNSMLNDTKAFGDLDIDKATRQRAFEAISKPVYKDKETGVAYTAVQQYEREHGTDFLKNVGLLYALTDGFKNLDKLVKSKVRKEVNKGLRSLESTLNNTSRTPDGNLKFVTGVSDDPEAFMGNWKLDI